MNLALEAELNHFPEMGQLQIQNMLHGKNA
jgi:hypothetical protein